MRLLTNCLICNSPNIKDKRRYTDNYLCKCKSCGFVFARRKPSQDELEKYYSEYSYGRPYYVSPVTLKRYREILKKFEPYRKLNKILDVGCGNGAFLSVAKEMGWECYGTEFSPKAVEACNNKGLKVFQGALEEVKKDIPECDIILSIEVIEHLTSPLNEVQIFNEKLRSGGILYVTTPNFNSLSRYISGPKHSEINYPEHLCYFTVKTIKKLLRNNGFKPLKLETTGISISRLQSALTSHKENPYQGESKDEKLRKSMEYNPFMNFIKISINHLLNITRLGSSLKASFVKR